MGTAWQRLYGIYGGIVSLAEFVAEHDEAISYDLLTKTGRELKDVGKSLTWDSLASFLINTEPDTALGNQCQSGGDWVAQARKGSETVPAPRHE